MGLQALDRFGRAAIHLACEHGKALSTGRYSVSRIKCRSQASLQKDCAKMFAILQVHDPLFACVGSCLVSPVATNLCVCVPGTCNEIFA